MKEREWNCFYVMDDKIVFVDKIVIYISLLTSVDYQQHHINLLEMREDSDIKDRMNREEQNK